MANPSHSKTARIPIPEHLVKKFPGLKISPSVVAEEESASLSPANLRYYVFADDRQVYGPATLGLLQEWAAQGLVSSETWVFEENANVWKKGSQIKNLHQVIPKPIVAAEAASSDTNVGQLRRIRLFSDMDDHQLEEILPYLSKVQFPGLKPVVQKGEHGSYMYLLLTGEANITTTVDNVRKILSALRPGDFFGESTLVEEGPRPFDVEANTDCTFLRLKHDDFQAILANHPNLASRFLIALVRHLSYLNLNTSTRFAQAKAFVKGSLHQTGEVVLPPTVKRRN